MTIRPGEPWGEPGPLAADAPVLDSDAAAAAVLQARYDALAAEERGALGGGALGEIGLVGGDLHRTLGAPGRDAAQLRGGAGVRFPVDVGVVALPGGERVFLAHLVAQPRTVAGAARGVRWWSVRTLAVMNAGFVDDMDLGPRSHPNDGRLDVTDGELPRGQRRAGRRRARTGTHIPHPALRTRTARSLTVDAEGRDLHVWLDGVHVGAARSLPIRCIPDAVTVVV